MPVRGNGAEMKLCNQNHKMAADDTVDVSSSFARQPHSTHIIIIDNIYTYKYLIFFYLNSMFDVILARERVRRICVS